MCVYFLRVPLPLFNLTILPEYSSQAYTSENPEYLWTTTTTTAALTPSHPATSTDARQQIDPPLLSAIQPRSRTSSGQGLVSVIPTITHHRERPTNDPPPYHSLETQPILETGCLLRGEFSCLRDPLVTPSPLTCHCGPTREAVMRPDPERRRCHAFSFLFRADVRTPLRSSLPQRRPTRRRRRRFAAVFKRQPPKDPILEGYAKKNPFLPLSSYNP